jgi:hypothetical protein
MLSAGGIFSIVLFLMRYGEGKVGSVVRVGSDQQVWAV